VTSWDFVPQVQEPGPPAMLSKNMAFYPRNGGPLPYQLNPKSGQRLRRGHTLHPAVVEMLACNTNIYCGNCLTAAGVAYYVEESGYAHMCLDVEKLRNVPLRQIEAMVIHESVHVSQYLKREKGCGCKKVPYRGETPELDPRSLRFPPCNDCIASETEAYLAQAHHLYPQDARGAADFYEEYKRAGIAFSCRESCKNDPTWQEEYRGRTFPSVPFLE